MLVLGLRHERQPARRDRTTRSATASGRTRRRPPGTTRIRASSQLHRLAGRGVAEVIAGAAPVPLEPEAEPLASPPGVVAQHRVHALLTGSRPASRAGRRRRSPGRVHRSRRAPRSRPISATMPSTAISRCAAEVLVESECEPRAVDARTRPLERQVVPHVERQLRPGRTLDRRTADLAVALQRMPVAGGEERAVDRNGQIESRPGNELLAVDVPTLGTRRDRRMNTVLDAVACPARRETAAASPSARRGAAASRRRAPSRSLCGGSVSVTPQDPGSTSSMRTASVCPARAPRTSIGPASACPSSSGEERGSKNVRRRAPSPRSGSRTGPSRPGRPPAPPAGRGRSARAASRVERQLVDHDVSRRIAAEDALGGRHVRVLDRPVRVRDVVARDAQHRPGRSKIACSAISAASSAPKPAVRGASCTITTRPVLATEARIVASSSGRSERMSTTSHETSAASAACSQR